MENKTNQKKRGRPKNPNGQTLRIRIRMTKEDFDRCKENARRANLPLSKFARIMILDGKHINTFSHESDKLRSTFIGMANNLNQLTKLAHTYSLTNLEKETQEVYVKIITLIDQYYINNK